MKNVIIAIIVLVIWYFTIFRMTWNWLKGELILLIPVNLAALGLIYAFFSKHLKKDFPNQGEEINQQQGEMQQPKPRRRSPPMWLFFLGRR